MQGDKALLNAPLYDFCISPSSAGFICRIPLVEARSNSSTASAMALLLKLGLLMDPEADFVSLCPIENLWITAVAFQAHAGLHSRS